MAEIAIVYCSVHHGNTKKVITYLAEKYKIDLISATENFEGDLSKYKIIGFASGVYMFKLHQKIYDFVAVHKQEIVGKKSFLITTSGSLNVGHSRELREQLKENKMEFMGHYACLGFDTYGLFKLIGGIRRNHPNSEELKAAEKFFRENVLYE